jgi:hypothetical protein
LLEQRKKLLGAVIALDPNHAEARKALGYQKFGSRWLTQDEYMQSQGYQRYKGSWRLKQEIEIESRDRQNELTSKQWRKDIRRWFEQLVSGGRHADAAARELGKIQDPLAADALVEILADGKESRAIRKLCLEMLARLPQGCDRDLHPPGDGRRGRANPRRLPGRTEAARDARRPASVSRGIEEQGQQPRESSRRMPGAAGRYRRDAAFDQRLKTEHKFAIQTGPPA